LARYIELLFTVFAAKIAKRILDDGWPESVEEQGLLLYGDTILETIY
jgi:hypothetical protein